MGDGRPKRRVSECKGLESGKWWGRPLVPEEISLAAAGRVAGSGEAGLGRGKMLSSMKSQNKASPSESSEDEMPLQRVV